MDDLHHGSYACTTSNHSDMLDEVGGIEEVAFWAFDANSLTWREERDMLGDVAFLISLRRVSKKTEKVINNKP